MCWNTLDTYYTWIQFLGMLSWICFTGHQEKNNSIGVFWSYYYNFAIVSNFLEVVAHNLITYQ